MEPRIFAEQTLEDRAREYERCNMWREAAATWKLCGRTEDADACTLILLSIANGDSFRSRVLQVAGEEPDVCCKEDSIKWQEWFKAMSTVKF